MKKLGSLTKNTDIFKNVCIKVLLHKYAPEKQKYVRTNQANFVDTELNHPITVCSNLWHKYLKSTSNKDRETCKNKGI